MDAFAGGPERDAALREALLDQPDVGVAICDEGGMLLAVNPALQSMLCNRYDHTPAESWSEQYQLHDATGVTPLEPFEDPLGRAVRGELVIGQLISVHTDQGLRVLRCRAHQLRDFSGKVVGGVVFALDATREVERHRQVVALREKLIETVNHELRTPLTAAKGHLELLQDGQHLPDDVQWSLDGVSRGLERLHAVVDSLRDVTDDHRLDEPPTTDRATRYGAL